MVRLIKVIKNSGGSKTTVYEGDDGNTYTLKGDLAVRANNPGNISPSAGNRQFWIDNFGAIAFVPSSPGEPHVAVFPDRASGLAAQQYLWTTPAYQNLTLEKAAARWATDAYPEALVAAAGVPAGTLVKDLTPKQMQAIFAAQAAAEGSSKLIVLDADGNKLDPAIITGEHPVPPGLIPATAAERLAAIQDRNAAAQGYGEIAPNVGTGRPAYFNETGAPPIPVTRSTGNTALDAARTRLAQARLVKEGSAAAGITSPAAMAVTPRLNATDGSVDSITDPRAPLDWGQFKQGVGVGGVGSLLDGGINPAALNPAAPTTMITGRPDAPAGSMPAAQGNTLVTGRPDAPVGSLPAAAARTDTKDRTRAGNVPVPVAPKTAQLANGKTVEVGKSYIVGDKLMIAEVGPDGTATLRDVEDVRDDWLRTNVDPNAPLLLENSLAGTAARAIAAPIVKQSLSNAVSTIGDKAGSLLDGVTSLGNEALAKFGSVASGIGNTLSAPKSSSSTSTGSTLSAPGAGLTPAQKSAISAVPLASYVKPLVAPAGNTLKPVSTPTTVKTTVANPAYADWVAKYGQDGTQVQTAPTGGMITAAQLAAIQNVNGAVQAPIKKPVAPPPPPPRTITVMKPGNTLSSPSSPSTPAPQPKTPTISGSSTGRNYNVGQTYVSGGYLKVANADGTFTKIGKVGTGGSSSGGGSTPGTNKMGIKIGSGGVFGGSDVGSGVASSTNPGGI